MTPIFSQLEAMLVGVLFMAGMSGKVTGLTIVTVLILLFRTWDTTQLWAIFYLYFAAFVFRPILS